MSIPSIPRAHVSCRASTAPSWKFWCPAPGRCSHRESEHASDPATTEAKDEVQDPSGPTKSAIASRKSSLRDDGVLRNGAVIGTPRWTPRGRCKGDLVSLGRGALGALSEWSLVISHSRTAQQVEREVDGGEAEQERSAEQERRETTVSLIAGGIFLAVVGLLTLAVPFVNVGGPNPRPWTASVPARFLVRSGAHQAMSESGVDRLRLQR